MKELCAVLYLHPKTLENLRKIVAEKPTPFAMTYDTKVEFSNGYAAKVFIQGGKDTTPWSECTLINSQGVEIEFLSIRPRVTGRYDFVIEHGPMCHNCGVHDEEKYRLVIKELAKTIMTRKRRKGLLGVK